MNLKPASQILILDNQYIIDYNEKLGEGVYGRVYKGFEKNPNEAFMTNARVVAIKE